MLKHKSLEEFIELIHTKNYQLGLSNTDKPNTLTFCDDAKFIDAIKDNGNIRAIITTERIAPSFSGKELGNLFLSDDPRFDFYTILNNFGRAKRKHLPSVIHETAVVHETAYISDYNVLIGPNTIIEANVTILSDVEIGANCIIRAGTVIGAEGFEHKRTSKGLLAVFHDGKVIIKNNVHIGALNAISKGFSYRNTVIDDDTRTDNLVHIAHCVNIGKRCLLPASCMIAGSVTIEDDVWIGPNSSVSSHLSIGSGAFITIGAVVTKNVSANEKVTGNFAIPHERFMKLLKSNLQVTNE